MASPQKSDFNRLFSESLDETLNQILGDSLTKTLQHYLQSSFSLNKNDVPLRVEEFAEALEKTLGAEAMIIEKTIVKHLYAKLEIDLTKREIFDFVDHIDFAKSKMKERK